MKYLISILLTATLLSGCAANRMTSLHMKGNGLVVAEMYGTHLYKPAGSGVSVKVDGQWRQSLGDGDTLIIPLRPGNHKLEAVRITQSPYTTEYQLNREFSVEQDKITSLGTAYPFFEKSLVESLFSIEPRTRYVLFWLPHDAELEKEVSQLYPNLQELVKDTTYHQAAGAYLTERDLDKVRHQIAARDLNVWSVQDARGVVSGDLGTVAVYEIGNGRKLKKLTVLPTSTRRAISSCNYYKNDVACLVPLGNTVAVFRNGKESIHELPANFEAKYLLQLDKRRLVVGDDQFAMYKSSDDGAHWELIQDKTLTRPVAPAYGVWVAPSKDGYYIYSSSKDRTVVHLPFTEVKLAQIDTEKLPGELNSMVETSAGLYLGARTKYGEKGKIYFRPTGSMEWKERDVPATGCYQLMQVYQDREAAQIQCEKVSLQTSDGGATWKKKN